MKPTHALRVVGQTYLMSDLSENDLAEIERVMINGTGMLRIIYVAEDPKWQAEQKWIEKRAMVLVRHIIAFEEL